MGVTQHQQTILHCSSTQLVRRCQYNETSHLNTTCSGKGRKTPKYLPTTLTCHKMSRVCFPSKWHQLDEVFDIIPCTTTQLQVAATGRGDPTMPTSPSKRQPLAQALLHNCKWQQRDVATIACLQARVNVNLWPRHYYTPARASNGTKQPNPAYKPE